MAVTTIVVTSVSIAILYDAAFAQYRQQLIETVKSHARLIEAIGKFNIAQEERGLGVDWRAETLRQVADAHSQFEGFGETGEFTLAKKTGSKITFVLSHRNYDFDNPKSIPFAGNWAEPMRLALSGESGTIIGLDYRGQQVLAAFEPLGLLDLGLVVKIDLAEIRRPFVRAGFISIAVALLAILISSAIFSRITRPIAQKIEQQAETFRTLAETALEGIILIDTHGIIQFLNPAAETLFGYSPGELLGSSINRLIPVPHRDAHDQYISRYLKTGIARIIGTGRQLTGLRKDGALFPIRLSVGDIHLEHTHLFTGVITDLSEQHKLQREIMELPVREQRRIGQELHDGLGQQLSGLGMLATSLVNKASRSEYELAEQLARGLKDTLSQVRALSRGLMPIEIGGDEFFPAIQNLCDEFEAQSRRPIKIEIDDAIRLPENGAAMHLYRITQEALNNAVKHAEASQISVMIKKEHDYGILQVTDNGCGLPPDADKSTGLGLRIMKYRCGLIDGEFSATSPEAGGTRIQCQFPIEQQPENN